MKRTTREGPKPTTYFEQGLHGEDDDADVVDRIVVGTSPTMKLPAPTWSQQLASVPDEPPLGFSVDDVPDLGFEPTPTATTTESVDDE
jgi:hypothetical protein